MGSSRIDEVAVNFIRSDDHVVPGAQVHDLDELRFGEDTARRVVGVAEHEEPDSGIDAQEVF